MLNRVKQTACSHELGLKLGLYHFGLGKSVPQSRATLHALIHFMLTVSGEIGKAARKRSIN